MIDWHAIEIAWRTALIVATLALMVVIWQW